ncbi:hypothetical protein GCM10022246_24560 [Pedobacter ginsengiterrae]|uniref:Uncharacterized protein n=2 Tax=Pedobacter ginsengiterrae TaxID=871696 RepID=A0ABP7PTT8_9SPHI
MLNDQTGTGLAKELYGHPLVSGLFNGAYSPGKNMDETNRKLAIFAGGKNLPSYIPARNFARALMDLAVRGKVENNLEKTENITVESIRLNISNLQNGKIERLLLGAVDMAQGNLMLVETNLQNWFDSGMDRVSGWYKRSTQYIIFFIGLTIAIGMNVNVFRIVDYLSKNDTARKILVEQAAVLNKDGAGNTLTGEQAKAQLKDLKLPIGWDDDNAFKLDHNQDGAWNNFIGPLLGWLFTALAATLGASYWFDLLNKVMVIRSTVKPHEKSGEQASLDAAEKVAAGQNSAHTPADSQASASEDQTDCCSVEFVDETPDRDLPVSKGGVAL